MTGEHVCNSANNFRPFRLKEYQAGKVKVGFLLSKLRALTQMKEYAFATYHF